MEIAVSVTSVASWLLFGDAQPLKVMAEMVRIAQSVFFMAWV